MKSIKQAETYDGFGYELPVDMGGIPYGEFVQKLAKDMENPTLDLLHAAVGVSGEAGELLDAVKKHWVYGKPLDVNNVVEELGDLMFYMQMVMMMIGKNQMEVIEHNIQKLYKRYASRIYSDAQAIARADKTKGEI